MKRFVGIIAALTMLCSVASAAAVTWDEANSSYSDETSTVVAIYTGLDESAQATLLAYKVDDDVTVKSIPEFSGEENDIVGIDQKAADGRFEFAIPKDFTGKKIAFMIGGTDVETPAKGLVEVGVAEPEPGDKEIKVEVTILWGNINGDDSVDERDAVAIISARTGEKDTYGEFTVNTPFIEDFYWGNINGDDSVDERDAVAIISARTGEKDTYGKFTVGKWYHMVEYQDGTTDVTGPFDTEAAANTKAEVE